MNLRQFNCTFLLLSMMMMTGAEGQIQVEKQKISLLGLFTLTNCTKEHKFECQNALYNEKSMVQLHKQRKFWFDVHLCTKDIRNSSKVLSDIVLPMVIQDKGSMTIPCRDGNIVLERNATIIFTYLSFHLTRMISSLTLPLTQILLVCVTDQPMYPAYYFEHPNAIYSYEGGFGIAMHKELNKVKNRLNISYGLMLNLKEEDSNITSNKKTCAESQIDPSGMCVYIMLNPNDCYKELNVNIKNQVDIEYALNQSKKFNISFIVLNGDSQSISKFIMATNRNRERMEEIFYLPFLTSLKNIPEKHIDPNAAYHLGTGLSNFQGSLAMNAFLYYGLDVPNALIEELENLNPIKTVWSRVLRNEKFQKILKETIDCKKYNRFINCSKDFDLEKISFLYRNFKKFFIGIISSFMGKREVTTFLVDFWKKTYYIENVNEKKLLNQYIFNPTKALKSRPFCEEKKPQCEAGEELVHSFYKEPFWTQSYGWNCQQCQPNFYKKAEGNKERCKQCFYPNTVNLNHTTCYDPFTKLKFQLGHPLNVGFIVTPSVLMALITMLTMVVFSIKRNTPIVLSANRRMTAIQLFIHLLLFILSMLLFLDTTTSLCIGRQVFLGVAFSITISINISKSQKLHMIVGKKILMSKSEIFLTNASEWFIILAVLITNAMLQSLSFLNNAVVVKTKYHDGLLVKESYCSNDVMVAAQLLMAAILSICNGIQGFRARHLPSQFRETNHVIYSSFISSVVFIGATATYLTSKKMSDRSFIILITTLIFNTTHFLLLYGYKVIVMVFQPYKNTKEAMVKKRLEKMKLSS